jgi:hypothetical protein
MFLHKYRLSRQESPCFQKAGLGTLSDGIFGVAMTLWILDVRLPVDFHPRTAANGWGACSISGRNSCPTY